MFADTFIRIIFFGHEILKFSISILFLTAAGFWEAAHGVATSVVARSAFLCQCIQHRKVAFVG